MSRSGAARGMAQVMTVLRRPCSGSGNCWADLSCPDQCGPWWSSGGRRGERAGGTVTGPRRVAVGVVAAVALIVVVRAGTHRPTPVKPPAEPARPVIEADEATTTTPAAVQSTTSTTSTTSATSAEGGAGVGERAAATFENAVDEAPVAPADHWRALLATDAPRPGLYRLMGDPAGSDLPPAVAARAAVTGSRFVVADVTGVGREAFPGWWGERPPVPVAATARVLAAGAASYGSLVQVVVVWDGTAPDGSALGEQASTVFLDSTSSDVFVPVHPGEVR